MLVLAKTDAGLDLPPKRSPVLMLDWDLRKGEIMVRKTYLPEQIINKLREADLTARI